VKKEEKKKAPQKASEIYLQFDDPFNIYAGFTIGHAYVWKWSNVVQLVTNEWRKDTAKVRTMAMATSVEKRTF
jgi:hypothetical protein